MNIEFNKGILAFEDIKNFTLKPLEGNERFKVLQAVDNIISFVTINPFEIYEEYEINLNDEILKDLEIKSHEEVLVLSIITLGETLGKSTMNLKAPLIINIKNKKGKQYILQNETYETKHPLIRRD